MKILIISPGIHPVPPVNGGAVENLIDFILKDNKKKYEIDCIGIYDFQAQAEAQNYKNVRFEFIKNESILDRINALYFRFNRKVLKKIVMNPYVKKVSKYLKKNQNVYDYIIVENEAEYGLFFRKIVKSKLLLHLHNDFINKNNNKSERLIDCYDRIICVSNFIKNRIDEVKKNNKTVVLLNGIDENKIDESFDYNSIYKKYNLKYNKKIIIFSGRVCKDKGVRELIYSYIKSNTKDSFQLLICGGYNYGTSEINEYIKELRMISQGYDIVFTGFIPYNEMYKLYNISYIGVIPSIINEACPLTAIEMIFSGLPVICTNSGGLPEIIDNNCGIIVERENLIENLKNAIDEIFSLNEKEISEMKKNALKKSKIFSKQKYLNNFWNYLEKFQ